MASIHPRQRDPLFDPETQVMIQRRMQEALGITIIVLALVLALALISYSPEDAGWMAATQAPVKNIFGHFGAGLSSALMVIVGLAIWIMPFILMVWGARFLLHISADRLPKRMIFMVILVAVASIFASSLTPPTSWYQNFGMGGLFGDTMIGSLLGIIPLNPELSLNILSVVSGLLTLGLGLWVAGFSTHELITILKRIKIGVMRLFHLIISLTIQIQRKKRIIKDAAYQNMATLTTDYKGDKSHDPDIEHIPNQRLTASRPHLPNVTAKARTAQHHTNHHKAPTILSRKAPLVDEHMDLQTPNTPNALHKNDTPLTQGATAASLHERIINAIHARLRSNTPPLSSDTPDDGPRDLLSSLPNQPEPPITRKTSFAGKNAAHNSGARTFWQPMMRQDKSLPDTAPQHPNDLINDDEAWNDDSTSMNHLTNENTSWQNPPAFNAKKAIVQQNIKKPTAPSRQALAETQPSLKLDEPSQVSFALPPLSLLSAPETNARQRLSEEALEENARMLESVLEEYGVRGDIVSVRPGPVVTMYELEPAPGLKASRVIGLSDDIARSMSALSARVSTIPGRNVIGIELPNLTREKVVLREILSTRDFGDSSMRLPLALGKDIAGDPIVANLSKMPHLLIAGTTGSGKSVAINTMILSLLYKLTPEECRMIMIDPKMLELSVYDGIPHLLSPVVTDPKKAVIALKWVVAEMEERYRKMSKMGVRNIEGYNSRVRDALERDEKFKRTIQTGFDDETGEPVFETEEFEPELFPYIVVVVDEMADLMMVAGKEIEACIQRLAQMARASGIHLIMATQRPSVDVITGTIKANFPTRISFQVTSKIDSRTILGEQGAEHLLGMGDMLYMGNGSKINRIHGPFVSDEEVEEIVSHLKSFGTPQYMSGVLDGPDDEVASEIDIMLGLGGSDNEENTLYDQATAIVARDQKCSTSYIQRKLAIGYNKAARIVEKMEEQGIVSTANHVGKREVLIPEPNKPR